MIGLLRGEVHLIIFWLGLRRVVGGGLLGSGSLIFRFGRRGVRRLGRRVVGGGLVGRGLVERGGVVKHEALGSFRHLLCRCAGLRDKVPREALLVAGPQVGIGAQESRKRGLGLRILLPCVGQFLRRTGGIHVVPQVVYLHHEPRARGKTRLTGVLVGSLHLVGVCAKLLEHAPQGSGNTRSASLVVAQHLERRRIKRLRRGLFDISCRLGRFVRLGLRRKLRLGKAQIRGANQLVGRGIRPRLLAHLCRSCPCGGSEILLKLGVLVGGLACSLVVGGLRRQVCRRSVQIQCKALRSARVLDNQRLVALLLCQGLRGQELRGIIDWHSEPVIDRLAISVPALCQVGTHRPLLQSLRKRLGRNAAHAQHRRNQHRQRTTNLVTETTLASHGSSPPPAHTATLTCLADTKAPPASQCDTSGVKVHSNKGNEPRLRNHPGLYAAPDPSMRSCICLRARRSMRDTCTCEMPSFSAISTCVSPWS